MLGRILIKPLSSNVALRI